MAHFTTRRLSRNDNTSFSEGLFSDAAEATKYILANISPQDFHSGLLSALTAAPMSLTQRQLDALLVILKAAGIQNAAVAQRAVADGTLRHCVRCHQSYLEKHNGRGACLVMHDIPEAQAGPHGGLPVLYFYPCCRLTTDGAESSIAPYHFLGRHTTQEKGVFYNSAGVRTCHVGCPNYGPPPSASPDEMSSPTTSRCSTPVGTTMGFEDIMQDYAPQRQSSISTESCSSDSVSEEDGMH